LTDATKLHYNRYMKKNVNITDQLRASGFRITPVRCAIIEMLGKSRKPLSYVDLKKILSGKKIYPNKTTIYRELDFLQSQKLAVGVQLRDGIMRYELSGAKHHHHIVCLDCNRVEDVIVKENLEHQEKIIAKNKLFFNVMHALEFYGLCHSCANNR